MKPTTEYIGENLKGLWEELSYEGCDPEVSEALIHHYKGVISEMMKGYAEEAIDHVVDKRMELFHTWKGGQVYKNEEAIEKLKKELV